MQATLVLNASYEPLATVPLHRAVVLVLHQRAEIVESDGTFRSISTAIPRPKVIRMLRYVSLPYHKRTLPPSKANVLTRDKHRCGYCARPADTVDHVVPRSRGGGSVWTNLVACCRRCNQAKGHKLLSELGWQLLVPLKPLRYTGRIVIEVRAADPAWQPYLSRQPA